MWCSDKRERQSKLAKNVATCFAFQYNRAGEKVWLTNVEHVAGQAVATCVTGPAVQRRRYPILIRETLRRLVVYPAQPAARRGRASAAMERDRTDPIAPRNCSCLERCSSSDCGRATSHRWGRIFKRQHSAPRAPPLRFGTLARLPPVTAVGRNHLGA
jgi:hypothetical protein